MIIAVNIDTKNLILVKVLSFIFGKIYVQKSENLAANIFDANKRVAEMCFSSQFPCRGVRDFDYGHSKRLDKIENYIDDSLGLFLAKTFPSITDVRRKIALIAACSAPYHATGHAICFAKSILGLKEDKVALLHNNWKSFMCATSHDSEGILVRHIYLPLNDLYRLGSYLLAAVGNLVRKVKAVIAFKDPGTYKPSPEKVSALDACRSVETATIFHLSQSYSNLYHKNHYFSDDVNSKLHRSKVVPLVNLRQEQIGPLDNDLIALFGVGGVIVRPLDFLYLIPMVLRLALRTRSRGQLLIAVTLIETYFKYRVYRNFFKKTSLKNVVIDYDILFSKPLALALESLGINTVALQERPSTSFGNGVYGCISNHYLYAGDLYKYYGELSRSSIICGTPHSFSPWRLRYFKEVNSRLDKGVRVRSANAMTLADFDSRILVLGYWLSDTQFSPLINKDSTDKFLKNVLLIGERFPKSSVVVRMKSIEGQQSELMLDLFAQHSNLFLCDDYSDFGISYFLCAQADVIVSVQTSLAEECLAYGKRVILIDDYGTFDGVCSDIYPEDFHFAIASSDVDLLKMISLCLANDASLDRKYQALASTVGACRGADPDATCRALEALLV